MVASSRCQGCGLVLPAIDGPTHRYMLSSPACWALYGEVLGREYGDMRGAGAKHRLTVDAYAAQHPGVETPQSIASVGVHLVSLCNIVERGMTVEQAQAALARVKALHPHLRWLEPPASLGDVTAADVRATGNAREHVAAVERWAAAVWKAWTVHHPILRAWAARAGAAG